MKPRLLFAMVGVAMSIGPLPSLAADLVVREGSSLPDQLSCLAMTREEAGYIIELSLLHPLLKHHRHGEVARHAHELKTEKRAIQHEEWRVKCI
jgi:hypothetical protein